MKLENIKTRTDFFEYADIQYQRTRFLKCIWQDDKESMNRKVKAFRLWGIMFKRMLKLNQLSIKLNQNRMSKLKQISISIERCSKAILKELNGEADPRRKEIVLIQCEKFNLKEEFIKKLLFIDDKRAYKQKRHHEKNKKFLN